MDPLAQRVLDRFTASSEGDDRALKALDKLKGIGKYNQKIPIPFGKPPVKTELYAIMRHWKTTPKTLQLADLTPTQETVLRYRVEGIIKAHVEKSALVVRKDGVNLVLDGHHRLTADYLRGRKNVEVDFSNLDSRTKK